MNESSRLTDGIQRVDRMLARPVDDLGDERELAIAARTWRSASVLGFALAVGVVAGVASRGASSGSLWSVEVPAWYLLVPVLLIEGGAAVLRRAYGVRLRHYGVLSSISLHAGQKHSRDWRDWAIWLAYLVSLVGLCVAMVQSA